MKRIGKSIISFVLVLLVVFSSGITLPQSVEAAEKQPRKIILNCTSKKMSVGQKYRLKVDKTKPSNASKEVIWTSSNEEIATINANGLVCAKRTGTVTITAQAKEADGIVAKCKVRIYKAAKKITLNHKSKTVYVGDSVKLKVKKVKPAKALKNVRWISSDKSIATVSDKGIVSTRKAGTVVITARDKGNRNVTAKCTIKIEEKKKLNTNTNSSNNGAPIELSAEEFFALAKTKIVYASSLDELLSKIHYEIYYNPDGSVSHVMDLYTLNIYDSNGQFVENLEDTDLW